VLAKKPELYEGPRRPRQLGQSQRLLSGSTCLIEIAIHSVDEGETRHEQALIPTRCLWPDAAGFGEGR
jgi:hypothetical protein